MSTVKLTLTLLVLRVFANYHYLTLTLNNFALIANFLY